MGKPRKIISAGQVQQILDQYAAGAGFKEIGDTFGHCVSVIRRTLTDHGVEIRLRGRPKK